MIKTLKATAFLNAFKTGRTCPYLMLCADANGNQSEIVVKLFTGKESSRTGLVCELMTALFARDLDLPVPEPFLVEIDSGFHAGVADQEHAKRFREGVGVNFGIKFLGPGYMTWPQERSIPGSLLQDAAEIFAFDLIVQNPDRRKDKPNLLRKSDELAIFDHEMAFSFLYALVRDEYPWDGKGMGFAKDHIFHLELKGADFSWDRIQGALESIDDHRLGMYVAAIPDDWRQDRKDAPEQIQGYLVKARDNSKKLFEKIREVLL